MKWAPQHSAHHLGSIPKTVKTEGLLQYLIDTLKEVWVAVGPLQPCNGHNHFNSLVPNVERVGGLEVQEPPHGVTDLGPVTGLHG